MNSNEKPQTAEDILAMAGIRFTQKARRENQPQVTADQAREQIERVKVGSKMGPSYGAKPCLICDMPTHDELCEKCYLETK